MRRAEWAKPVLLVAMAGWTLVVAASGCWALGGPRGGEREQPSKEPVSDSYVLGATSVAASRTPSSGDATRSRTTPRADTPTATGDRTRVALPTATATDIPVYGPPVPRVTPTPRPFPVPEYARSASGDPSASELGPGSPAHGRDEARSPSRGVVVLDPGHGRGDPGAVHYSADGSPAVLEADSNLRNAVLIRDELAAMGYDVYLTRDGAGRGPDGPLVQQFITSDLLWRAQLAAAVEADVYLALHGNGAVVTSISGPETWYCGVHEQGSANAQLAAMVQQATMDALHEYGYYPPNRGIIEDAGRHHSGDFCQFVVTRETVVPSALLEFLFLSNDADARVLADDQSHRVLARHVAAAIDRFLSSRPH